MQQIKPLFNRVDHISIICDRPQDVYTLHNFFVNVFQLPCLHAPIEFAPCKCYSKKRLSTSVFFGNLFIQLVHFYNIGELRRLFFKKSPKFSSLVFETSSLTEARGQLRLRDIRFSDVKVCSINRNRVHKDFSKLINLEQQSEEINLFRTHYIDPYLLSSSLFGQRPFDYFVSLADDDAFVIGLKSYEEGTLNIFDIRKEQKRLLQERQEKALGFLKVDRIVFSTNSSMVFTAFFDHLFSPLEPLSLTEWQMGDCPLIKLEENQSEGITHVDLKVSSLIKGKEFLEEKKIPFIEKPDYLLLTSKELMGLRFILKE